MLGSQSNVVDLGQIMILGREPENRNAINASCCRLFRQFDCGQRFENRKQRPAKKTDLLSGDSGQCASLEPINICQRFGGGSPGTILALENFAHLGASRLVIPDLLGFVVHPLGKKRRTRIESANRWSVRKIIEEERCGVWDLLEGQTLRFHWQVTRQLSLHSSLHRSMVVTRIRFLIFWQPESGFERTSKVALPRPIPP